MEKIDEKPDESQPTEWQRMEPYLQLLGDLFALGDYKVFDSIRCSAQLQQRHQLAINSLKRIIRESNSSKRARMLSVRALSYVCRGRPTPDSITVVAEALEVEKDPDNLIVILAALLRMDHIDILHDWERHLHSIASLLAHDDVGVRRLAFQVISVT